MQIPLFRPYSSPDLEAQLKRVISSGEWTGGIEVAEVESLLVKKFKFPNFICTSSATSAFEIILDMYFSDVKATIVVPINTFATTAEVPKRLGHKIVFCDVDSVSGMIDITSLEQILKSQKVDCVVPVSIGGHLYDRDAMKKLKNEYGFRVVEDLAQLIYPECFDLEVDAAFFSFYPNKILSSPDGGGLIVSEFSLVNQAKKRRLHGICRKTRCEYDIEFLGRKANMTNIDAVFLKDQISSLSDKISKRLAIYQSYAQLLEEISDVKVLALENNIIPSLFVIHARKRNELKSFLEDNGVQTSIHFRPLHLHSYWNQEELEFPGAEEYYSSTLSLPFFEMLKEDELNCVISLIKKFYSI
ncbi:DegT/DnrJ/EryC1/StrS family aminotransferase [Halobacteriovorax sp. RZ-2]|uniref:DegT/DnrJ/EryC1/StrS family aminotransferase n=1 Tax=unclassified Halobacteriovorax TaxID=2639665 RepID=UPI003722EC93